MTLIEAERKMKLLGQPVVHTTDVAALLGLSRAHASKIMSRLAECGRAIQLVRGRWAIQEKVEPLLIPEYLTAPSPSYISLQTALFHHGLISQIPSVIYAVTTSKSRRYKTPLGTFSTHHLEPEFFFGFEMTGGHPGIKIATPEKALIDFFYLSPARSGLFHSLPEVELPKSFKIGRAREMITRIQSKSRRTIVSKRFEGLLRIQR